MDVAAHRLDRPRDAHVQQPVAVRVRARIVWRAPARPPPRRPSRYLLVVRVLFLLEVVQRLEIDGRPPARRESAERKIVPRSSPWMRSMLDEERRVATHVPSTDRRAAGPCMSGGPRGPRRSRAAAGRSDPAGGGSGSRRRRTAARPPRPPFTSATTRRRCAGPASLTSPAGGPAPTPSARPLLLQLSPVLWVHTPARPTGPHKTALDAPMSVGRRCGSATPAAQVDAPASTTSSSRPVAWRRGAAGGRRPRPRRSGRRRAEVQRERRRRELRRLVDEDRAVARVGD